MVLNVSWTGLILLEVSLMAVFAYLSNGSFTEQHQLDAAARLWRGHGLLRIGHPTWEEISRLHCTGRRKVDLGD